MRPQWYTFHHRATFDSHAILQRRIWRKRKNIRGSIAVVSLDWRSYTLGCLPFSPSRSCSTRAIVLIVHSNSTQREREEMRGTSTAKVKLTALSCTDQSYLLPLCCECSEHYAHFCYSAIQFFYSNWIYTRRKEGA